ncbi:dockerin type I domain-containing protein, partial [Ruminococcus sp.]|uniref:dockerin type I domain-containing protein n=1 Tax=Ruminococcus sp. TaxID=41978 RepID=UPI0025D1C30F
GTVEINADATYKYTDAEGKTSSGTVKLGTDKIEGKEFTVLSFYEGTALKYTAYSAAGSDVLSLGNGNMARFVKEAETTAYSLGDVNNDNVINAIDASNILSHYAMSSTSKGGSFTEAQVKAADVNSDGSVNSVDASCVLSYYAYNSTVKTQAVSFEKYLTAFNEG